MTIASKLRSSAFAILIVVVVVEATNAFTPTLPASLQRKGTFVMPPRRTSTPSLLNGSNADVDRVSIGFLGFGTIALAIARGMSDAPHISDITVTRRSQAKSQALLEELGADKVTICDNPQDVVDASDYVFCTVLPQQMREMLQSCTFDATRHVLVSLVSTSQLTELVADSELPTAQVYKMICLPSVARKEGVSLLCPKQAELKHPTLLALLQHMGGYVQAENEDVMSSMMVPSGLMGGLYGSLRHYRDWLVEKGGVPRADAAFLVSKLFWGMMQDADRLAAHPDGLDELVDEQTPGGLNEQGLRNMEKLGVMGAYDRVMEAIWSRIKGEGDGNV